MLLPCNTLFAVLKFAALPTASYTLVLPDVYVIVFSSSGVPASIMGLLTIIYTGSKICKICNLLTHLITHPLQAVPL